MTLAAGTRLGPYEVIAPLGAGGMGEVYRAKDTRLERSVALKVLPEEFFKDEERKRRFEREAKLLAALNHPNIAAIYAFEETPGSPGSPGRHLLVMEIVEGDDLAQCLAAGPLPLEESLSYAKQIAEALEAAHEKGIVHRDLKPANVKVTPDGKVKLLDFGLAKILESETAGGSTSGASQSPTLTARATAAGVILGTAAYMSPEQARGKSVDKRADIWAFGAVLYEMLSGRKAFAGETVSDTLAAVLTKDPEWSALPLGTPPSVRRVLKRCLDRDMRTRLHDIADARLELNEPPEAPVTVQPAPQPAWRRAAPWVLSILFALAAVAALLRPSRQSPSPAPPVVRVSKPLHGLNSMGPALAISPDGTRVVFAAWDASAQDRLELWKIEESETRPIAGSQGYTLTKEGWGKPFFSPDGEWIGFVGREKSPQGRAFGGRLRRCREGAGRRNGGRMLDTGRPDHPRAPVRRLACGPGSGRRASRIHKSRHTRAQPSMAAGPAGGSRALVHDRGGTE